MIVLYVQARVTAGTKPELVVLMDIPNVKAHRARLLYAAGLKTAEAVAGSSEATLMSILAKGEQDPSCCLCYAEGKPSHTAVDVAHSAVHSWPEGEHITLLCFLAMRENA